MDAVEYILSKNRGDYQRDNFDSFLKKVKFSFSVPAIHIAGTNGKGSVAHYLCDIYTKNGYKVGLFTSPDEIQEMIKIGDMCCEFAYIESVVDEYKKFFEKYDLSTFEIETFIALKWFQDSNVDLAIIECGMGGEYDATNIFTPVLSIITSVSIEHSDFLGVSLSEIAQHKAGIIKKDVPVLIGDVDGDALNVIVSKAKKENSQITVVDKYHNYSFDGVATFDYRPYYEIKINSGARYRAYNACLAIEATNILKNIFPVKEELLKEGLLSSKLKCRFEVIDYKPTIILDGAHNPHGINKLREEFDACYPGKTVHIVFASFRDKNISLMLPEIGLIGDIHLTTFDNKRARTDSEYFLYLEDYEYSNDYQSLIDRMITEYPDDILLITGSLTFTYVARAYLKQKGIIND